MFKLAVRFDYRIKGRCPRHPAYNPIKDEQAGIRGGCVACHELLDAYRAYLALREAIEHFETTAQPFITAKKTPRKRVQASLLSMPELPLRAGPGIIPVNGNLVSPEAHSEPRE